jgi:hypothetical protein
MRNRLLLASAGAVTVALTGAAPALAADGTPSAHTAAAPVIKACVNIKTGVMRWVNADTPECRTGEWMTAWNAKDPAGDAGDTGPRAAPFR